MRFRSTSFVPPTEIPLPGVDRIRFYATFRSDVLTRGRRWRGKVLLNFIGFWAWKGVTIDRRLVANHLSAARQALHLFFLRGDETLSATFDPIKRNTNIKKHNYLYHHEFWRRSKRCWRLRRGGRNHRSFQQVRVDWLIDWLNVLDGWDGLCLFWNG